MQFTKLTGTFTTQARGTLRDTRTAYEFTLDMLALLQQPALATLTYDVGFEVRKHGGTPGPTEQGVFACAYASLAGALVRTFPMHLAGRVDVHTHQGPIEQAAVHALLSRHYSALDVQLVVVA